MTNESKGRVLEQAARQESILREIDKLQRMPTAELRRRWGDLMGAEPSQLGRNYLIRRLAYRVQELAHGGVSRSVRTQLSAAPRERAPAGAKRRLQPGTRLLRDYQGQRHEVVVQEKGFLYDGKRVPQPQRGRPRDHRVPLERRPVLRPCPANPRETEAPMSQTKPTIRCAVYTRKSHEEGLDQEFNSLDAQRQAAEAYVESQRHEGWRLLPDRYDDGGFSGGNMERPALARLLGDIRAGRIDCVVVYKVDRLSRSLLDFSQLISLFDQHEVSFVSVTQQFNTTTSMGRLTLNILLSFAQFEREIIGERIRDKKLATARQGKYIGGQPVLGLDIVDKKYVVKEEEAELVRRIFHLQLKHQSCRKTAEALNAEGLVTKRYQTKSGKRMGGKLWKGRNVYDLLTDRKYLGRIVHKGVAYEGEHPAIIDADLFDKVQAVLSSNKTYTHKHQVQRFALLRGLLRCGHCGSLIQPSWTKNHGREYRYYTCSKRVKTGYENCPLPSLSAGEIEKAVVAEVRTLLRHPGGDCADAARGRAGAGR